MNLVGTSYVWEVSICCHASLHVWANSGVLLDCWISLSTLVFMPWKPGKQFNRALGGPTLAYEILTAMKLAAFVTWCETSGEPHVVSPGVWRKLVDAQQEYKSESKQHTIMQEVCDVITQHLLPKLHKFQR